MANDKQAAPDPTGRSGRTPLEDTEKRKAAGKMGERSGPPAGAPMVDPRASQAMRRASRPHPRVEPEEAAALEGTGRHMAVSTPRVRAEGEEVPEDTVLADSTARQRAGGTLIAPPAREQVAPPARTRMDGRDFADRMPQRHPEPEPGAQAQTPSGAAARLMGKALAEAGTVEEAKAEVDRQADSAEGDDRRLVLEALLEGERAGKDRKGVVEHIEARLNESEDDNPDGESG